MPMELGACTLISVCNTCIMWAVVHPQGTYSFVITLFLNWTSANRLTAKYARLLFDALSSIRSSISRF